MIVKLVGSVLVVLACTAMGFSLVRREQERYRSIEELCLFLMELARLIRFSLEPLPSLLAHLAEDENAPARPFAEKLKELLDEKKSQPFRVLWQEAAEAYVTTYHLPAAVKSLFNTLGSRLGQADSDIEADRLARGAEEIRQLLEAMKKDSAQKEKNTKTLGALLGVLIVIMLL